MSIKQWRRVSAILAALICIQFFVHIPLSLGETQPPVPIKIYTALRPLRGMPNVPELMARLAVTAASTTMTKVMQPPRGMPNVPQLAATLALTDWSSIVLTMMQTPIDTPIVPEPTAMPEATTVTDAPATPDASETQPSDSLTTDPISPPLLTASETPAPVASVTPTPVASVTPTPEVSVTPTPEVSVTPTPEVSVTPTPEASLTPTPEASVTPIPEASVTPIPEVSVTPGAAPDYPDQTEALPLALGTEGQALNTDGALSGGDISFSDFSSIVLDGTTQTATAVWLIGDVIDSSGTGNGWNISLTLTQFRESYGPDYVTYGDTLDTGSLTVTTKPIVTVMDELSTPAAQITVIGNATVLDTGIPVKLLTSGNGQGMGSYSVSAITVSLKVPADVYAHTYKTDATIALISAP